jgi:hypothetical protein
MRLDMMKITILLISLAIIFSCSKSNADLPYLSRFDFDGDHKEDRIEYSYSGGAHCCYQINLFLSSTNAYYNFPFQIDGGYVFGLDDSQPDTFYIDDFDKDGLPEIFLKINTYNGELLEIPQEWQAAYNIHSNRILIDYVDNQLIIRDYTVKE